MRETAGNTKKGIAWKAALAQTAIKKRTTTLQHKEPGGEEGVAHESAAPDLV